jgi:hypothetical protein
MTKHHRDPPPTAVPLDHEPTNYVRRGLKRGAIAFAAAALTVVTCALMPIAFAVGGAALGVWWAGATFYEWLESQTDEEPLRS